MSSNRSLAGLSNKVLLSQLGKLVKQEKRTTLSILMHLAEVDQRDLYLEYGFSSLFDYCVGDLGYSRSAAGRRIASARCIRRYPEVFDLLESGNVNLTTVGHIAPILSDENKDLLLREIQGKTERQVESIVARFKPPIAYRDRVRPVRVAIPQTKQNTQNRRNSLIFNSRSGSAHQTNSDIVETDSKHSLDPEKSDGNKPSVKIEKRMLIQFLADEGFMSKLEEVKSLLSNKIPNGSFEDVFEAMMDEFIDRHSPRKREERREKRRGQVKKEEQLSDDKNKSRYIPVKTRDAVYKRDGGKCTYKGTDGRRCGSTHDLQIDHIKPFARGGGNTLSNLRLLCAKHNRHEAKRMLGAAVVNRHIMIDRRIASSGTSRE